MQRTDGWWKTLEPSLVIQQPQAHIQSVLDDLHYEHGTAEAQEDRAAINAKAFAILDLIEAK